MTGEITQGTVAVDGIETFYRRTAGEGVPVVFSHGNPDHSAAWTDFGQRLGGAELVELPDAGHGPWFDRPDLIARVTGFLDG